MEARTVSYGSALSLSCCVPLEPPVSYIWRKHATPSSSIEDGFSFDEQFPENAIVQFNGTLFIPQITSSDSGTYVCVANNTDKIMKTSTVVIVEGIIPRFLQSPVSYLSFNTLPNAYLEFDLTISIKPEKPNGLILYNGNDYPNPDFISIGLLNHFVEFRFELGGGVTVIRSEKPIELNQWHVIHVSRKKLIGNLKVDNQNIVTSSSVANFIGLSLDLPLYIGGVPDFNVISTFSGQTNGFVGCLSNFKVGFKYYDLIKESVQQNNVSRCDTCLEANCQNGGICKENVFHQVGYECVCAVGFNGKHCELTGDTCYPGLCRQGSCLPSKSYGYECQCPFGKAGQNCERDISITDPLLTNGAYLAYQPPANSIEVLNIRIKIKPNFASNTPNQLLLYSAQEYYAKGDYVALTIESQTVVLRFDTGSGPVVIRNPVELIDEEWVDIELHRYKREANITVANSKVVSGVAPGNTYGLTLLTPLYIGGYNRSKIVLPNSLDSPSHFEGCIGYVSINNMLCWSFVNWSIFRCKLMARKLIL